MKPFLDAGISFASLSYRLTDGGKNPYPIQMLDCARALQFIRSKAGEWNLDPKRVAILADGWGSSLVARGLAFDDRFAAAVCDGGIWDLHERAFLMDRNAELGAETVRLLGLARVARNIQCPVLISSGERGWLKAERVRELYDHLKADGRDVTLKIFTSEETAAAQGHADNPTLANEFIFDWVTTQLGIAAG